jgi:hypothetical protein
VKEGSVTSIHDIGRTQLDMVGVDCCWLGILIGHNSQDGNCVRSRSRNGSKIYVLRQQTRTEYNTMLRLESALLHTTGTCDFGSVFTLEKFIHRPFFSKAAFQSKPFREAHHTSRHAESRE